MGTFRTTDSHYGQEWFCPSTKVGSFVNGSPEIAWGVAVISGAFVIPVGIGLAIEVSAFFSIILVLWVVLVGFIVMWCVNSYKFKGVTYTKYVLPVEIAYAGLTLERQKQYRHLVVQAYKNVKLEKSNRDIVQLFKECAELDNHSSNNYVQNELEVIRNVRSSLPK